MKKILVEGWRGIHQSLALVNQYQIRELAGMDGVSLRHRDLPFSVATWSKPENKAGFPAAMQCGIDAVPPPSPGEEFDAVYRIAMPFDRSRAPARRHLNFLVSEFALRKFQFADRNRAVETLIACDDLLVTPSNWARMKLIEFGFAEEAIRVVPHGVSEEVFFPLSESERESVRGGLEIGDAEFVFLNLGSLTREKGLDVLIQGFSEVRRRHENARLMLKDTRGLYGLELEGFFQYYMANVGPLSAEVLASIYLVPPSMTLDEMRRLYGAADCYVSPYRAEGFNLPVIEAVACGLPVIVTAGGATDDFCNPGVSRKIEASRVANTARPDFFDNESLPGYHLEPSVDSLVEQMADALGAHRERSQAFVDGRRQLVENFSWQKVSRQLSALF